MMANAMKLFCLLLLFSALGNVVTSAQQLDCPNGYSNSKALPNTNMKLFYSIVPNPSNPGKGLLCAKIVRQGMGWIGFGISTDGKMDRSEAIIGLPDENTVKKYNLGVGVVEEMANQKQTLMGTSIDQNNGITVMTFTKYMKENGQLGISAEGANTFIYAQGNGNTLGYHEARGSFQLNFAQVATKPAGSPTNSSTGNNQNGVCLTAAACKANLQKLGLGKFIAGNYQSKGCYSKNGNLFFSRGGTVAQMSKTNLLANEKRVYCKNQIQGANQASGSNNNKKQACLTKAQCKQRSQALGIEKFIAGDFPSKGCYKKNGKVFFSSGSQQAMTIALSGNLERIYC